MREIPFALGVSEIISMSQVLNQRHPSWISHAKFFWSFSTWVGSTSPSCTIGAASFVHGGWSCYGCRLLEIWTCHPKTGFGGWLTESWCWMNSTQFRISFCKISRKTLIVGTQKISQVLPETKQIQFIMHHSMNAQERTDFDANQCDPFENC